MAARMAARSTRRTVIAVVVLMALAPAAFITWRELGHPDLVSDGELLWPL
jgi:hypothetical protein